MGTATFSICKSGYTNNNVRGAYVTGGAHTTSTTASNLTDGAAGGGTAVVATKGNILTVTPDEAMRVMFGGEASSQTVGHICPANIPTDLEVTGSGNISITDVA